jgi:hypothetical protein
MATELLLTKRLLFGMAFWVGLDGYELLALLVLLEDDEREDAIKHLLLNAYRR